MGKLADNNTFVRLESGIANLGTNAMTIVICEGGAWVTHNGSDIPVYAGQEIELAATRNPVLISILDGYRHLVFKQYEKKNGIDFKMIGLKQAIDYSLHVVRNFRTLKD